MRFFKIFVLSGLCIFTLVCQLIWAQGVNVASKSGVLPKPTGLFSPSQVRTLDGNLIPVEHFFSSSRCAGCHADTHAAWSQSLHRNAAREPFYRESADILLRTRGIEFTRHCESCHTPIALVSGALTSESGKTAAPFTPLDHEGVTCTVCHSIVEARLDGTGSFTLRRPALLAQEDGTPIFGDFTDEQILANIPAHKRAVMRPLLRQPEFCATCHKVTATPELNGYKQIPGFSAYDEWQQSGASQESPLPFYRREKRQDCRACHMPKVPSLNDRAAKNGVIASHRWLGANTAAPLFYGQTEQVQLTQQFLESNQLAVDIFSVGGKPLVVSDSGVIQPLEITSGEEVTVEVVIANRNVAHSFPPEVRDLYEAWVEFEALDAAGNTVFHSGFLHPNGMLDERAHVYKTILLDEEARTITRHQIWLIKAKGYDNTIAAGKTDLVRYRFKWPSVLSGQPTAFTLRAKVNYRRLNQEYVNYVLHRQQKSLTLPVVTMATAEIRIGNGLKPSGTLNSQLSTLNFPAKRWNDYGIALLEQGQFGEAAQAFRQASELDPQDANLLVNAAIAELRTERFAPERTQQRKAAELLERAYELDAQAPRVRFYRALVLRAEGRHQEAMEELKLLAQDYPRDREVQRQLGQTLLVLGKLTEARVALETVLTIDPNDAGVYQLLSPLYAGEGRSEAATHARSQYLQFRDDPQADGVSARFFAAHPEWQDVRTKIQVYHAMSPRRPVLTGTMATPSEK